MKLPNIGYRAALWQGRLIRNGYRAAAPLIVQNAITPARKIDIDVFAYSNEAMVAEQIASIRSFLRYVGRPNQFTVISDGTHSAQSIRLLRHIDSSVRVRGSVPPSPDLPDDFRAYLTNHATGKQLALIMSLPRSAPALYVDADVRFFPGSATLLNDIAEQGGPARYLADCAFFGDARLLASETGRWRRNAFAPPQPLRIFSPTKP
jgi:hypothetical protein